MKKVILVTGASSGLGLATANALAAAGHTVYGTSRDAKRIKGVNFNPLANGRYRRCISKCGV
jgi:NADP-dependent 3-hydroxy acid dehydrogenase YdfG